MAPTMMGTSLKACWLQMTCSVAEYVSYATCEPVSSMASPHNMHDEGHLQLQTVLCLHCQQQVP